MIPLLLATTALAQDVACPEGYLCLSDEDYAQIYQKLVELKAIEEGAPTVTFTDPLIVITDRSGRVLTNGTWDGSANQIHGKVVWGHMSADLLLKPEVKVQKREEPNFGFRLRPRATASYLILETNLQDPLKALDAGIDLDFVYAYRLNLSAYLGARSVGLDVGLDVFKNSGVDFGMKWTWPSATSFFNPTPSVGWYFAF